MGNGLNTEDKASGCQTPLGEKPQSKLCHYAVDFETFEQAEPYHLCWQHVVRNNSPRSIFDWLAGENCSDKKNGPGHIVCHCIWHIRGTGSFSLDDKFLVQCSHKGCVASSERQKLCSVRLKTPRCTVAASLSGNIKRCDLQHKCGSVQTIIHQIIWETSEHTRGYWQVTVIETPCTSVLFWMVN